MSSLIELYDRLVVINKEEPERFEQASKELLDKEVVKYCKGDEQKLWRARGLLRSQNKVLSKIKDPIARCNVALSYMWESFRELNNLLQEAKNK